MQHWPAFGDYLERYEVGDGAGLLGIASEKGDIVAYVHRPDGTRARAYGGPVYDPPEFKNICERGCKRIACPCWDHRFVCDHKHDLTRTELAVATLFARKVGWLA